ncbi:hypothetical protein J3P95_19360 [Pseudomonas sp. Z5-35]|uniref:hypothetical protein n=1 Tax=unclassified Pseudomonas TaxID=196821 RepID=UPI003DA85B87
MKKAQQALFVALGMAAALQCLAADINFSSATDFTTMNLRIEQVGDPKPDFVTLDVTLSPDAQRRMAQVSREEMNKPLRLFINGILVSTPTVRSVIDGVGMQIAVPSDVARSLIPTLLEPLAP